MVKIESPKIRVLAVDDHPLFREGIATVLRDQPDMFLVAEAASGSEAIRLVREHRPDVILMDLELPDLSGLDAMAAIRTEFSQARFVVLSTFEHEVDVQRALHAGAWGFLLKSVLPQELTGVIRHVHAGRKTVPSSLAVRLAEHLGDETLTSREVEVLECVAGGFQNRNIGQRLFIAEGTVKRHMKNIMQKLGAHDRTQAATIAARRGIIRF